MILSGLISIHRLEQVSILDITDWEGTIVIPITVIHTGTGIPMTHIIMEDTIHLILATIHPIPTVDITGIHHILMML